MNIPLCAIDFISHCIFRISPNSPYYIFTVLVIFGPTVGYFDQLRKMIVNKSSLMFNKHTSLIQMLSNLLRFIYWRYEPFIFYLLGQSCAVMTLQLTLSFLSFHYMDPGTVFEDQPFIYNPANYKAPVHSSTEKYNYLRISQAKTAKQFFFSLLLYFCIIVGIFQIGRLIVGTKNMATIDIVSSNVIDSFTSFPQFVQVVWFHEYERVSTVLVIQFLAGDLLKLSLYLFGKAAWPFVFGASLQTFLDTILLISYSRQTFFSKRSQPDNPQCSEKPNDEENLLPK